MPCHAVSQDETRNINDELFCFQTQKTKSEKNMFFIKINSKKFTYLSVKHKIIKLLEDNIGENLGDLGYHNILVDPTLKAQSIRKIIDKMNFMKVKIFCYVKYTVKRISIHTIDLQRKYFFRIFQTCGENICKRHI